MDSSTDRQQQRRGFSGVLSAGLRLAVIALRSWLSAMRAPPESVPAFLPAGEAPKDSAGDGVAVGCAVFKVCLPMPSFSQKPCADGTMFEMSSLLSTALSSNALTAAVAAPVPRFCFSIWMSYSVVRRPLSNSA